MMIFLKKNFLGVKVLIKKDHFHFINFFVAKSFGGKISL